MENSLTRNKLFGIKTTTPQTETSTTNIDVTFTRQNKNMIKKALLEAERKKAEATTILRRYTLIR
jgi:hypothetical protein